MYIIRHRAARHWVRLLGTLSCSLLPFMGATLPESCMDRVRSGSPKSDPKSTDFQGLLQRYPRGGFREVPRTQKHQNGDSRRRFCDPGTSVFVEK